MLRTELNALVDRGYQIELSGFGGYWTLSLKDPATGGKVFGKGRTPEEAVAEAVERSEYRSGLSQVESEVN